MHRDPLRETRLNSVKLSSVLLCDMFLFAKCLLKPLDTVFFTINTRLVSLIELTGHI